jgi:uncharacterized protein YebE (UPF0316 family)
MFEIFDTYPWLLPIVIFFGRICDVTLGALRIIFASKAYPAYARGYAAGNFIGILVENKIAFGYVLFRIYTRKDGRQLAQLLNKKAFLPYPHPQVYQDWENKPL